MAKIDLTGLIGSLMVGGSEGYSRGRAAQEAEDIRNQQRADAEMLRRQQGRQALDVAQIKRDGMLALEKWKAGNAANLERMKQGYQSERQTEELASKERIAGIKSGASSEKAKIAGIAKLREAYRDFLENEFDSEAEEGWWFGIGAKEGNEPPDFEEWASAARPEEAKYYGVESTSPQAEEELMLEGSVEDIIARAGVEASMDPDPVTPEDPGQDKGLIGEEMGGEDVVPMPEAYAKFVTKRINLPESFHTRLMENPEISWKIVDALKNSDAELIMDLLKQL